MKIKTTTEEREFLSESNKIEGEYSNRALEDSIKSWEFIKPVKVDMRVDIIKKIHRRVMRRLNPKIAGKFRKCKVFIGNHECVDYKNILPLLESLCLVIPKNEKEIFDWHVEFERIHPFVDGNGRVGRIIMNFQRLRIGLNIIIIHSGKEQNKYYKLFKKK